MLEALRVTPIQTDLVWHDPEANRQRLAQKLIDLAGKTDIAVLPEMFTSGFTQFPETLDKQDSTFHWMQQQAADLDMAIVGSLACAVDVEESSVEPRYVNRLFAALPDGSCYHYDKIHLFRMGDEHLRYRAGDERVIIHYRGWRLFLTVCYDLRFPVFCCNNNDYDVMLCVANWPASRRFHWRTLLQARAIENQAYVVGVNRIGTDGNGLDYQGDSMVIDMRGERLFDGDDGQECTPIVSLSYANLSDYRESFPVWKDADRFTLQL